MKKKLLAITFAAIFTVSVISGCGCKKDGADNQNGSGASVTETRIVPTLMYLVSGSDANLEAEEKLIGEVAAEYEGRAEIQVINIEEKEQAAVAFNVTSADTPAALMLDETGSMVGSLIFHCETKEQIEELINSGF